MEVSTQNESMKPPSRIHPRIQNYAALWFSLPAIAFATAAESNWEGNLNDLSGAKFVATKDAAEADLPFPTGIDCATQAMTANIIGSGTGSPAWIRKLQPGATIYSWALNNHWHTNFPLFQEGKIPFRYRLLPHTTGYNAVAANRFGVEQAQPLIETPVKDDLPIATRVAIDNPKVYATILKTTANGKATILRLRSLSDQPETAKLSFPSGAPKFICLSDATEVPGETTDSTVTMLPYCITTLRLEFTQ